jgi:hypothetical protein
VSAPLFNAFVTRLNAESLYYTGKTLGYIVPLLYEISNDPIYGPLSFIKITTGGNDCGLDGCGGCYGYTNSPNISTLWTPVNGNGSPLYDGILSFLINEIWSVSSSSTGSHLPPTTSYSSIQTCKNVR